MNIWFLCKIKYQAQDEQGNVKPQTEFYLFEGVSYTDAETRIYTYFEGTNLMDFEVANISKLNIQEVFLGEEDVNWWFKVKVQFFVFDEKTKKEKKVPQLILINAKDVKMAFDETRARLGDLEDYIISDVNVTKIEEVLPLEEVTQKIPSHLKPVSDIDFETSKVISAGLKEIDQFDSIKTEDSDLEEEDLEIDEDPDLEEDPDFDEEK